MNKVHLCCGSVYLKDYENCDIVGEIVDSGALINLNETTIDKYFKFPFEQDFSKRQKKEFKINTKMNILEKWKWGDESVDEILMINAFEHFEPVLGELDHIINEAYRVLKPGGTWNFDFPNIKEIVDKYYKSEPSYCMELIYCNRKNKYSAHCFGYTYNTLNLYLTADKWGLKQQEIVKHDYPSSGVIAKKL